MDTERSAVRRALNEERSRYCAFVSCIKPMLDEEACMVSEFQQLEEVSQQYGTLNIRSVYCNPLLLLNMGEGSKFSLRAHFSDEDCWFKESQELDSMAQNLEIS